MKKHIQAAIFGVLLWLIPLVISICIYPLKKGGSPLFETIMAVTVTLCVVFFAVLYFRNVKEGFLKKGVWVGLIWAAMSVVFDLPMSSAGPMKMSIGAYFGDIGLTYLIYPLVTIGMGLALRKAASRDAGETKGQ